MAGEIDWNAVRGCFSAGILDKIHDFCRRMPAITEVFSEANDARLLGMTDTTSCTSSLYCTEIAEYLGIPSDVIVDRMAGPNHGPVVKTLVRGWNETKRWVGLDWPGKYAGTAIRLWCDKHDINDNNMVEAWAYVLSAFSVGKIRDTVRPFFARLFDVYCDHVVGIDVDDFICQLVTHARYKLCKHRISPRAFWCP